MSFAALAVAGAVAACSSDPTSSFNDPKATNYDDGSPAPGVDSFAGSDAAAATERALPASPLCGSADGALCLPDDPSGSTCSTGTDTDAGALADASTKTSGCRIEKARDEKNDVYAAYAPACASADFAGTDGVSCTEGADCAPGFDCVTGEKGSVCRRYCCSGSCEDQTSQNGGPTFCDIQQLVDHDHGAPVCMPLKPCKLFADGDCSSDETCAVVTESGGTGCVAKGAAKVDQPCDEEHCEGGLTCLGSPGDRRCYKLCQIDGAECSATQRCTPGSLFHDMKTGVCKDADPKSAR